MSTSDFDDDLFRPTLTRHDDAVGMHRPWSPGALVIVSFFFGLAAAGPLLALNYGRLGRRGSVAPTMTLVILLALAAMVASFAFLSSRAWEPDDDERFWYRTLGRVFSLVVCGAIAWHQSKRYRMAQFLGEPSGKLLKPVILALLIGGGSSLMIWFLGMKYLDAPTPF
ncbi:MAG: hypothetical protein RL885_28420 [Planctomycetota bacterium]